MNEVWQYYDREYEKIETFEDPVERQKRFDLIEEFIMAYHNYEDHLNGYEKKVYKQSLMAEGICFQAADLDDHSLKELWAGKFAGHLSDEIREKIYFQDFHWHIFSYEHVAAIEEDKAISEFNKHHKGAVYVFYQHESQSYYIDDASKLKHDHLKYDRDVYILDKDLKWTYVKTHAPCGPYFKYAE